MARTTEQRDLDRQNLLDTLAENGGQMWNLDLISTALAMRVVTGSAEYSQAYADLVFLLKAGAVVREQFNGLSRWTLVAAHVDVDVETDRREVDRLMAGWVEA